MNKISFIIPVYNRLEYNQECLKLLEKQKNTLFFKKNEIFIIIVDDGSTDGTGKWIRENYPEVIVLRGTGDLWYSGSLNFGIRYALNDLKSDFIMIWENDVTPVPGYFDNLQHVLENWDGKSLISSKLNYKVRPDIIFSMGGTFNPRSGAKGLIARNVKDGPPYDKDMEVDWFSGQMALIHKNIIEKVGYFDDTNFPQYHADIDYSLRAKKAGFRNMVYASLILLNDSEATGINHMKNKSLKQFFESLHSIRSNLNIKKDIKFYKRHVTSFFAYRALVKRYIIYTGSFIKWKTYSWLGIKKQNDELL